MFLRALAPVWAIEVLAVVATHLLVSDAGVTWQSSLVFALSVVGLPWLAGYRVASRGGSRITSVLGGVSVSGATLLAVAAIYAATSAPLEAFGGFIIATLMFAVVPQLVFGGVGHWSSERHAVRHI